MPGHSYKGGGSKFTPTPSGPPVIVLSQHGADLWLTGGLSTIVYYLFFSFDSGASWGLQDQNQSASPIVFSGDASPGWFYASPSPAGSGPVAGDSNVLML